MQILDRIANVTRERISREKEQISLWEMRKRAEQRAGNEDRSVLPFAEALRKDGISLICEVKKASPSRGVIDPVFPYRTIAREYQEAGADAVSCLTEPFYFQGIDQYFREIRREISLPMLRKDFVIDDYMVYQAKDMGADAILLICSLLDDGQLFAWKQLAEELGMSVLMETHDRKEIERALHAGAEIIGVNNRNLKDFTVDTENSCRLRKQIPSEVLFVAESGISHPDQIRRLEEAGTDAVLVGETLMRASDKSDMIRWLTGRNGVQLS